jgi:mRNA-degrading endonuclease HigB of HigAB toxin-antitoxin module
MLSHVKPYAYFGRNIQTAKRLWRDGLKSSDVRIIKVFDELRDTFPSADKVGKWIIFNIRATKYRLITVIHFPGR